MTESGPSESGASPGQLSPDGDWVWDGAAWEPAVSPDGHWRWNGQAWIALTAEAAASAAQVSEQPWPDVNEIDDAKRFGSGPLPPKVDELPSDSKFASYGLAIGQGWVARRPVASWHLLQLDQLRSIAIVPPTALTKVAYSRSVVAPDPDVALQDLSGNVMRFPVGKLDGSGRLVLSSQIPRAAEVTASAAAFLRSGSLPGKWAKRFQFAFKRLG